MRLSKAKVEILDDIDGNDVLAQIERAARTCYKSEEKICKGSAEKLVAKLIESGHMPMIEFVDVTVKFTCDRGVSHELVRHRLASFAQESTRYCNYKGGVEFIIPPWNDKFKPGEYNLASVYLTNYDREDYIWLSTMQFCEAAYLNLIAEGYSPQKARSVLPNSLKTEVVMKANLREWIHFFNMRCSPAAHPQMRELANSLKKQFKSKIPIIFDDKVEE